MESSAFDMLKQIYGTASTPVAAADTNLNILWKNSAAETCELFNDGSALSDVIFSEGARSVYMNGDYRLFSVIKLAADNDCFVIEYIGKDTSRSISHMKDYFSFLCARLRESASQISMATDAIDLFTKTGDTNIAPSLNKIERNVKLLLKEALVPETLMYAADPFCKDEPINLAHNVALFASDAEKTLGRLSEVWQNDADDVCAAVNQSVFEPIIALMTAEVCCGKLYPERVEFTVARDKTNETRGSVSVRSICISDRKNPPFSLEILKQGNFFTNTAFKDILAKKYGIAFEAINHSDGKECIMHLDVLPKEIGIVKTDTRIPIRPERFSPMATALSEKHCGEHYKNIKMN